MVCLTVALAKSWETESEDSEWDSHEDVTSDEDVTRREKADIGESRGVRQGVARNPL
jgi:hypothetical protein